MSTWLDTETKALLQHVPPEKYAPPDTDTFTLVLLKRRAGETKRLSELLARIPGVSGRQATRLAHIGSGPVVRGLSFTDALMWQFEVICCDTVSIFLKDEVVESATHDYLNGLYSQVQTSPEFDAVTVRVDSIPYTEAGVNFVNQFFVSPYAAFHLRNGSLCPYVGRMMHKKARIMKHWAEKIGAKMVVSEDGRRDEAE